MKMRILLLTALLTLAVSDATHAASVFHEFVTVHGDQLMEGGKPYRFVSFNIPNLQMIEDNVPFSEENPWRLPDRFEIFDALESVRQMGGTVVRTYVISVVRTNDAPGVPRHILGPGKFNEEAFRSLDQMLQAANETGVRVIIPLVDNWSWMGGAAEYAGFRGKEKDAFWKDPQIIADYKQTIQYVLTRTNTLTGVPYREDKSVMAWETGNEINPPANWTREIAAYIKQVDPHHLVIDGFNSATLRDEVLNIPETDVVTTHFYPNAKQQRSFAQLVRQNQAKAKGKKPYFVGEVGFVDTKQLADLIDAVMDSGSAGIMLWSLRFHDRDGGFYWHAEPDGANHFKAYHWPGFASGADYDEKNVMELMRKKAYEIRSLPEPPIAAPEPPHLLPIADVAAISWQGSAGAEGYTVECAPKASGPWKSIGENISDADTPYRPLFADANTMTDKRYYRVRAQNRAGTSKPSNVVGPVQAQYSTLVDEMTDFSMIQEHSGQLEFNMRDARKAKEDCSRLEGQVGSTVVYRLQTPIRACRLSAFFSGEIADFKFSVSTNGTDYVEIPNRKEVYFHGAGDYGYWKPVLYECQPTDAQARFLKIQFRGQAQIARTEITSGE